RFYRSTDHNLFCCTNQSICPAHQIPDRLLCVWRWFLSKSYRSSFSHRLLFLFQAANQLLHHKSNEVCCWHPDIQSGSNLILSNLPPTNGTILRKHLSKLFVQAFLLCNASSNRLIICTIHRLKSILHLDCPNISTIRLFW